ncbi:hypothetical protein FHG89_01010 [Micromonospora orduensis]|uniref:DUF4871 domain-containing protein n=1 Tax=Micromonospora orduensis TaxID=1420891 RepID=A0A5C4QZX0_9ACTN|nr:hypothetical protein [Micromonospora orduensis]TNH31661.1 hypothetical protein FHG89_01010 [Micromonospora orduensis]
MGTWVRFAVGSVLLLAGCTTGGQQATSATPSATSATSATPVPSAGSTGAGCHSRVETGALPDWADTGFHGDARVPHVFGAKGDIVAVLFAHPLAHARPDGSNNKILWVSRTTEPSTLVITATLDGTDTRVTHEVAGGPGPSIIDVPRAGCWHLDLSWAGHTDTMDLIYAERTP